MDWGLTAGRQIGRPGAISCCLLPPFFCLALNFSVGWKLWNGYFFLSFFFLLTGRCFVGCLLCAWRWRCDSNWTGMEAAKKIKGRAPKVLLRLHREFPRLFWWWGIFFFFSLQWLERNPQLSLATRGEDWASQGQPKRTETTCIPRWRAELWL